MDTEQRWWERPASDLLEVQLTSFPGAGLFAALSYIPVLLGGVTAEPVRPCRVVIRRRSDCSVVKRSSHLMRSAARDQCDYMSERLASENVRSFCTEFQITPGQLN